MERPADPPPVAVVLNAYHDLGLGVCRHLSRSGGRVVVVDSDPAAGEALCRRLAWEGGSASYRFASPEQRGAGGALLEDLELVYGRVDWLISFFSSPRYPLGWLRLQSDLAAEILDRHINYRLDFLRALTPLLERSAHKSMIHVALGVGERAEGAVADLWDRLLSNRWHGSGIITQSLLTTAGDHPPGTLASPSSDADLARLIAALGWGATAPVT